MPTLEGTMNPELKYPRWQAPLHAAILEVDRGKLHEKLETAEVAISSRTQELAHEHNTGDESRALADSLYIIQMLKRWRLQREVPYNKSEHRAR